MPVNTTHGPQEAPRGTRSHINTSAILEPPLMTYEGEEEEEIISVLPGTGWQAVIGGQSVPLVAFVALDSGKMHGVVLGSNGLIDLNADVENNPNFVRYARGETER